MWKFYKIILQEKFRIDIIKTKMKIGILKVNKNYIAAFHLVFLTKSMTKNNFFRKIIKYLIHKSENHQQTIVTIFLFVFLYFTASKIKFIHSPKEKQKNIFSTLNKSEQC